ncbi:unnamed protein product [Dimorphilus gyrociliatus]|uniref:Uncharacterized protein n=1 Tax=Dimorphilus gyrociliatus TaxID=2664684 RepID=A0A7I8VGZ9_9ANNE|nr:unnamed protein product [Dimorphilus gyrociliatus]
MAYAPDYNTEYSDNFRLKAEEKGLNKEDIFRSQRTRPLEQCSIEQRNNFAGFISNKHKSIFRDEPSKDVLNKPYGRRLMHDETHPDLIYGSQWSSELADHNGCYSFPTTTNLQAEHPFYKNLEWMKEGETGNWPTNAWKEWTQISECPKYDGYSDQVEYSKYKTNVY